MIDRVTLITGASTGIGAELARVFASNGHRLALVDRRGDRLQALATEMVAAGGAAPILIACDLEQSDACDKIAGALAAERVEVEFVVNNAGFGLFGYANELDRAEQLGIIAVNIVALTICRYDLRTAWSGIVAASSTWVRLPAFYQAPDGRVLRVQGLRPVVQRSAPK
jgi:uncharacterized protein